eukprot:UN27632
MRNLELKQSMISFLDESNSSSRNSMFAPDTSAQEYLANNDAELFENKHKIFKLNDSNSLKFHNFRIIQVDILSKENFIITIGADYSCKVYDLITSKIIFTRINDKNCNFTCFCWDRKNKELILIDENNRLTLWNIDKQRCIFKCL